ncbi:hypothetical protein BCR44DRAFT_1425583 [Catenaria anguillulae PL171]|uniref:Uncharacterized protein n=1 Tax=Catenaria anguillulae PL171 TaxID=765915 RepID=A0A1Y2HYQ4_9FUNG|nr:hypothetical protein BCR44DRAFT_1425583 [Catenaria anguillulae PL171]
MQEAVDKGDQVVFLTHSGPATSATTLIRTDVTEPDPIWKFYHHVNSGSPSFLDILRTPPKPTSGTPVTRPLIPLVLHGHSHWSRGVHRINASTVVNPGSFKDCAAGLIELKRDAESGEWKVGTVELIEF